MRAAQGAPEGLWLRADRQTGGKGRQGRTWLSPPGNLHVSTLIRLRASDPAAPTLALVAAVALHQTLSEFVGEIRIKWPNDLMIDGAKLAGILLERSGGAVVIGFGANLAHHPDGLERSVTSLAELGGQVPCPVVAAEQLATSFHEWLHIWRGEGLAAIRMAWLAAAHPLGTLLSSSQGEGRFAGLDENGSLRLEMADGTIRQIHAGDVFLI